MLTAVARTARLAASVLTKKCQMMSGAKGVVSSSESHSQGLGSRDLYLYPLPLTPSLILIVLTSKPAHYFSALGFDMMPVEANAALASSYLAPPINLAPRLAICERFAQVLLRPSGKQFERHSKDDSENKVSQKGLDASDTIAKNQAMLDETAKDSDSSKQFKEEEEDEKYLNTSISKYPTEVSLPSGKVLEDILFQTGMAKKRHHLIHSFIIDVDDQSVRSIFEPMDWAFIVKEKTKETILEDKRRDKYVGIESTKRRNQQKKRSGKKIGGSKSDGYLREFGPQKADWLSIEGVKYWDPDGHKYKKESAWKIGRQLHDILRSRAAETDQRRTLILNISGFIFRG
ncbi:hypothetical protein BGZ54_007916 [Gamsiella multidivaricata]|nr:hypothetical protein BGZ54_007916 [Gamsiella multidivaricata]